MKVQIDLEQHAQKLRAYDAAREAYRIAKTCVSGLEHDLNYARMSLDDARKALAKAEGDVAANAFEAFRPYLDAPGEEPMPTSGNST